MNINKLSNISNINENKPSFGSLAGLGKKIISSKAIKGTMDSFEYNGFSMSVSTIMLVLYGFTIFPRYFQAVDKHDKREILTRDLTSLTAILFFAKALSRGFSRTFSKISGFALNNKPKNHDKSNPLVKLGHYLNPVTDSERGIDVLNSQELTSKYSNLKNYKNGIIDFFKFIKDQNGNVGKVLNFDKTVKENANKILGKDVKTAGFDEINAAFKKAKGSDALEKIYKVFEKTDNPYVKHAKTMNSFFGFISTVLLVPGFMIWLEKFNESTTKKIVAKEKAQAAAQAELEKDTKTYNENTAQV
jgi:hypothetical protein